MKATYKKLHAIKQDVKNVMDASKAKNANNSRNFNPM